MNPRLHTCTRVAIVGVGLATMVSAMVGAYTVPHSAYKRHKPTPQPTRAELAMTMIRLGLEPRALTAAGVTPEQVPQLVRDLRTHWATAESSLVDAETASATAARIRDRAEEAVRSGQNDAASVAAAASARSALASAITARESVFNAMFHAATSSLDEAQVTTVESIRRNQSYLVPAEYTVANRTEAEWIALRDAISAQRNANERGDTLPQSLQQLLDSAGEDPGVTAARTRLASDLAAMTTAWTQAMGQ